MTRMSVRVGMATAVAALTAWPAPASLIWDIQDTGDSGVYVSLRLDASQRPHFSYGDSGRRALQYAEWSGTSWQTETVDNTAYCSDGNSLALDSQGRPWISYSSGNQLKLAHWTGSAWSIENVKYGITSGASVQLDSLDRPHLAYVYNQQPEYARWNGTTWDTQTVDTAAVSGRPRLLLDSQERPRLGWAAYTATSNYCVKYAAWNGATWDVEVVAGGGGAGDAYFSAFVLNAADEPRMLYSVYDGSPGNPYYMLKYAERRDAAWQARNVVRTWDTVGGFLGVTAGDSPRVTYYNSYVSSPSYLSWNGSSWDSEVIQSSGGRSQALVLDRWDYPHVMYASQSVSPFHLKYASGRAPLAVRWPR